jgi:isopenicillin-N epimerase
MTFETADPAAAVPDPVPPPASGAAEAGWALDPTIAFLNHGSFGARPRAVLEAQQGWRRELEARPVEFFDRRRDELIGTARAEVGRFLGMDPADFGFVTNATEGVNAVLRSLRLEPGDELITTGHVYNAVRQSLRFLAERRGAIVRELELPLPLHGPEEVVTCVAEAIGDRTRLVIVDHVTSPTAVVMPVRRIAALCADRGVDVLVDGAHGPGMLDLAVAEVGATYYAGNLHKWVCAPPGAAFLWVRPDRQPEIHPLAVSHFFGEGLSAEFAWQGTRDVTAWLSAGAAIDFFGRFGWEAVRAHNHALARWAHAMLTRTWDVEPCTPLDGSLLGSMATVPVPAGLEGEEDFRVVQARLYDRYRIEVPVVDWGGRRFIRVSCQVYNRPEQYERLAEAVRELGR